MRMNQATSKYRIMQMVRYSTICKGPLRSECVRDENLRDWEDDATSNMHKLKDLGEYVKTLTRTAFTEYKVAIRSVGKKSKKSNINPKCREMHQPELVRVESLT